MALPILPIVIVGGLVALMATRGPRRGDPVQPAAHRDPLPDLELIPDFHAPSMAQIATECLGSARFPSGDPGAWSGAELDAAEQELAACIGDVAYPDVVWPAIAGDSPSVELVWQKLLVLASEVVSDMQSVVVEPPRPGRPLPPVPTRRGE